MTPLPLSDRVMRQIIDLMETGDVSQRELAKRLGVTEARVSQILGRGSNLTLKTVDRILAALTNSGAPVPGDGGLRAALAARLASDAAAIDHARKTSGQVESYLAALAYRVEAHLPDILAALAHAAPAPSDGAGLPDDVVRLVIAARMVAWEDPDPENLKELQAASEAFASRVPWEDEPEDEA